MKQVDIYRSGLLSMSVCAPKTMPIEDILADCEDQHLCGTDNGWMLSENKTFKDGKPMPCACENDFSRQHWLLEA